MASNTLVNLNLLKFYTCVLQYKIAQAEKFQFYCLYKLIQTLFAPMSVNLKN